MTETTIELSEPEPTGPVRDRIYLYRGEAVSIGGAVDWAIRHLAVRFAGSTQSKTGLLWDDLKASLKARGLTDGIQPELAAVKAYFAARNMAAHARTVVVAVGAETQILRLYFDRDEPKVEPVVLDDFAQEAAIAREGHHAVQMVGRALDQHDPCVLAGMATLARAMLLGTASSGSVT